MRKCFVLLLVITLLFLLGCSQQVNRTAIADKGVAVPTNALEKTSNANAGAGMERKAEPAKPASGCEPQVQRQFGAAPYYGGPLVDAHLHMPSLFPAPPGIGFNPAVLGSDVEMQEVICLFDKEGITKAIGFFLAFDFFLEPSLQVPRDAEKNFPGRIVPFLMPAPLTKPTLSPQAYDQVTSSKQGLFKGYGELHFYFPVYRGRSPDDYEFLQIFKVADKHNHVVMIHSTPETMQALEIAIQQNPEVIFLLHGAEVEDDVVPLLEKYGNVYYSLDANLFPILYGANSKEEFRSYFRQNFSGMLEKDVAKWKKHIEANPNSFVWGTDRGEAWHFDEEVGSYLVEFSRAFIGRLSPEVQEKIAYKNAERLLAREKTGIKAPVAPITKTPFTGMESLCTSLESCVEFCRDNYGRCKAYCEKNPTYALCVKSFPFESGNAQTARENIADRQPAVASTGGPPVLSNLGFDIAPWDRATNMAGDLVFTKKLLYNDGNISNDKVFMEFGHSDSSRPGMPWVEYWFFVPLGTKVRAPAGGAARVSFFDHTKDWGVNIEQGGGWTIGLEHLAKVFVKSGDTVNAGDIIGEAAPRSTFNNEVAMTELAVYSGGAQVEKYCPFEFLDAKLKPSYSEKLSRLARDWEEFVGKDVYLQEKWVAPGCLLEKIIEK